jgi:predicted RNase H-like nuclease (RuvC/YqgF family)
MNQPLQVVSKLLTGQRIITLEQTQKLILNTNITAHWFITGEGLMLEDQSSSVKESKMAYYISGNRSSKAIAAMLPLVSDLEERIEDLKKENENIKEQLSGLENSMDRLKKRKSLY